ncbi:MAG: ScpA family protein [Patescibacteria group bacterium]
MYQIKTEQFSGPLDLLLQLIENQKLDISQVSLAQVTDQYLAYLDEVKDISATELADFLVVATKLLVIKSKILLPQTIDEEEDSAEELEAQLKIYKDYQEASKIIEKIIGQKRFSFSRERIAFQFEPAFSPPPQLNAKVLSDVFGEILKRIEYVVSLPQKVMERTVSLREMVTNIREHLREIGKTNFYQVLKNAKSRTEVVVCFMALLELIKQGEVVVKQKGVFDEIMVESIKS